MVAQVEVPDGYRVVTLVGVESDGTPQVVHLDGTGRIVAVIQGEIEGIAGPVDVAQVDSAREIQGSDGSTLRTVKLDANGQLIMVPRGQSGNYMSVDASGFLTSVMKGDYTGTPTTLAVDSSGNIVAVIKGEYSGVLKTVATDADGRMIMIPTDPADVWGNAIGMGNAELAACLTPAKRMDHRGNVLWWDSFDNGLSAWQTNAIGTLADVCLSTLWSHYGPYSCKLTAGSSSSRLATIVRTFRYPGSTKIGVEILISWGDNVTDIDLRLTPRNGTYTCIAAVHWVTATNDFEYYDSAGAWQDIDANKPLLASAYLPHYFKLVIDLATYKYVRAILDDEEYDLSTISFYKLASGLSPRVDVGILLNGDSDTNPIAYVDNVVATQNEPA